MRISSHISKTHKNNYLKNSLAKSIRLIPLPFFILYLIYYHFYSYTKMANAHQNHAIVHEILEGEARLKKSSSSVYESLNINDELHFGDLIYSGNARVSIKCNNDDLPTNLPRNAVSGVNYVCPELSKPPRRQTNIWEIFLGR